MDSLAVLATLGPPDSVSEVKDSRDPDAKFVTWRYPTFVLELGTYNSLGGVEITGPGVATPRGLRVGDSIQRVRQLYGPSCDSQASECQYEYPGDAEGLTVIQVRFAEGVVKSIYLGHLYD